MSTTSTQPLPFYPGVLAQVQAGDKLAGVLAHAAMRRALHDDEHMPAMPIWGSSRWFDRVPLASTKQTPLQRNALCRALMSGDDPYWDIRTIIDTDE